MIKWPEPYVTLKLSDGNWVEAGGDPEVRLTVYSEAQLKQAVREAYEDAAKACDRLRRKQIRYFNSMGSAGCPEYGPSDCADAIRALIKEI